MFLRYFSTVVLLLSLCTVSAGSLNSYNNNIYSSPLQRGYGNYSPLKGFASPNNLAPRYLNYYRGGTMMGKGVIGGGIIGKGINPGIQSVGKGVIGGGIIGKGIVNPIRPIIPPMIGKGFNTPLQGMPIMNKGIAPMPIPMPMPMPMPIQKGFIPPPIIRPAFQQPIFQNAYPPMLRPLPISKGIFGGPVPINKGFVNGPILQGPMIRPAFQAPMIGKGVVPIIRPGLQQPFIQRNMGYGKGF